MKRVEKSKEAAGASAYLAGPRTVSIGLGPSPGDIHRCVPSK